ncbi:hypothetical protein UFOVP116_76 [uncultured Caudovirales phage]|uniref:Uncharacterized protein n=1 Tax=uncultured Caudovirales phage TaxID=2100421 RepID=A0A6J5L9W6_9CAUD|nr:hypothetical protein UFOVP116_76 [uncultured Caudovirales phage]
MMTKNRQPTTQKNNNKNIRGQITFVIGTAAITSVAVSLALVAQIVKLLMPNENY